MMPVRVAVVGLGYWGPKVMAAVRSQPDISLAACCDLDVARLASVAALDEVRLTTSLTAILADRGIDAIIVATPAATHHALATQALLAGKHVFVEKPLATNAADATDLARLADTSGRVLMVGHLYVYHPGVARLVELVRNGKLGEIRYVQSTRASMSGTARRDTNIVWDSMVHDAYLLSEIFGEPPLQVSAAGRSYLNPGIEDIANATLTFAGSRLACCFSSWYVVEKVRRMMIVGNQRMAVFDDLASDGALAIHDCGYVADSDPDAAGRRRLRWRADGVTRLEPGPHDPLRAELEHFFECVRTNARPRTDGWAGVDAVMVLEALDASIKAGGLPVPVAAARAGAGAG